MKPPECASSSETRRCPERVQGHIGLSWLGGSSCMLWLTALWHVTFGALHNEEAPLQSIPDRQRQPP